MNVQLRHEIPVCALLDRVFKARLAAIIAEYGITTVVETGIDKGGSTRLFADMVPAVIGIDNMPERIEALRVVLNDCGTQNVRLVQQNSPDALAALFTDGLDAAHTLFFLDAHWQSYWPLRDEIRTMPKKQGVLVMHDARVPGCPTLGVDKYKGQELSYEYVKAALTEWSPTHRVEYNDDTAEWPRRGVMYVYPS